MTVTIASGLGATLGLGVESTPGTAVVPTRFLPFQKNTLVFKPTKIQDESLHGGLYELGSGFVTTTGTVDGGIDLGVYDRGMGMLFQQMLGGAPVITAVAGRTVTDGVLNSTTTVTSATAAFTSADVGMTISGTGIPGGTTIASVTNATTVIMSAAATATASGVSITIGSGLSKHVYQPGNPTGKSLTAQAAKPLSPGGTIVPFTWAGLKVTDWTFDLKVGGFATLSLTVDAWTESIVVTYTAPSYVTSNLFNFRQAGTLSLGGTASTTGGVVSVSGGTPATSVTDFQLKGKLSLDTGRFFIGAGGVKGEQIANAFWKITGQIGAEFANTTDLYTPMVTDTPLPLQLTLTGPAVGGGGVHSSLAITLPHTRIDSASPTIDGQGILKIAAPFQVKDDGANAVAQFVYTTLDPAI